MVVVEIIENMMRMSEMLGLKTNDQLIEKLNQAIDLEELQVPEWINDDADDAVEM